MSSFLDICNDVARESGTFPNRPALATTDAQQGREYDLTQWVVQAYEDIQRSQPSWRWLNEEFSGGLLASTRVYASDALGITERFARWIERDEDDCPVPTIYKTSEGQATERHLRFVDYSTFRRTLSVGTQAVQTGRPNVYSVDDQNRLVFFPTPDAEYTVRGKYYKAPQQLTGDSTVPEMPEQFHRLIQWKALLILATFDEAFNQLGQWQRQHDTIMGELRLNQLPPLKHPGALA